MKYVFTIIALFLLLITKAQTVTGYGSVTITGHVFAEVVDPNELASTSQLKSTSVEYVNGEPVLKLPQANNDNELLTDISMSPDRFLRINGEIVNLDVWRAVVLNKKDSRYIKPITPKATLLKDISTQPILTHNSKAGIDERFCFITINYN
jgi:hypothetical protein